MANQDQLKQLAAGVTAWNMWRRNSPEEAIDLSRADLRDEELAGVNLSGADLTSANFRGANLDGADLSSTNLSHSNFKGARLQAAIFDEASGQHIDLSEIEASRARFIEVEFKNCEMDRAKLHNANLKRGVFKDSSFVGAELFECNLSGTDFRDSNMSMSKFDESSLERADFRRSNLSSASFKSANLSKVRMTESNLRDADLTDATLTQANLLGADGLICEQLYSAKDWETTYRDETVACGANIPEEKVAGIGRAIETSIAFPVEAVLSSDEVFGEGLSHWRNDIDQGELKARIDESRNALNELENALTEIQNQPEPESGGIGHNRPPEPIIPNVITKQYISEIRSVVMLHDAPRPEKGRFIRLREMLGRLGDFLKRKIGDAANTTAKAFFATVGAGLGAKITGAWEALGELVKMIL